MEWYIEIIKFKLYQYYSNNYLSFKVFGIKMMCNYFFIVFIFKYFVYILKWYVLIELCLILSIKCDLFFLKFNNIVL